MQPHVAQVAASEEDLKAFQSFSSQQTTTTTEETETNKRSKMKTRDEDYYIPHAPSDFHSEKGLSVVGSSFDSQAASAVLDLGGDEGDGVKTHKQQMKW